MEITSVLDANPNALPFSNRSYNFCGVKVDRSVSFRPRSQFLRVKGRIFCSSKSLTNWTSTSPPRSILTSEKGIGGAGRQSALAAHSVGLMGGLSFQSTHFPNRMLFGSFVILSQFGKNRLEVIIALVFFVFICILYGVVGLMERVHVMKLQVGLLVSGQSLQQDLNQVAKTIDTSNSLGWCTILKETTKSLLRHEKHWISSYSFLNVETSSEDAKKCFKKLSNKEWSKCGIETLINLDNMRKEITVDSQEPIQPRNTYMVVTILVAASQMLFKPDMPIITNRGDLVNALKELLFISENGQIEGINVFWTPQKQNDILSLEEFKTNYPYLSRFSTFG